MDQSYLIELDSNLSPTILINHILQRLNAFIINKAHRPIRLSEPPELSEEELLSSDNVEKE